MLNSENLHVVFIGHVDHGKSTLIGRLLYDTDSLPTEMVELVKKESKKLDRKIEFAFVMDSLREEKEQAITIDTAQTFFKSKKRDYIIIDSPGHKEFLKNMITGATQAEAAVLIVDAQEGVREQTKRHIKIISLLGINQLIVALNKMDTVDYNKKIYNRLRKDLNSFFKKINIIPSYYIPISSQKGDNVANQSKKMPWYAGPSILEALDTFKAINISKDKPLRFPVQDIYKIDDKRIIVGQIASGVFKKSDRLIFLPRKNESKIRSIEKYNENPVMAEAGESIGITLKDKITIEKGAVASLQKNAPSATTKFAGHLFWLSKKHLKKGDSLKLQCATQEISVVVEKINNRIDSASLKIIDHKASELLDTEIATVTMSSKAPIILEDFNQIPELGRFTLLKDGRVVAGGIVNNF